MHEVKALSGLFAGGGARWQGRRPRVRRPERPRLSSAAVTGGPPRAPGVFGESEASGEASGGRRRALDRDRLAAAILCGRARSAMGDAPSAPARARFADAASVNETSLIRPSAFRERVNATDARPVLSAPFTRLSPPPPPAAPVSTRSLPFPEPPRLTSPSASRGVEALVEPHRPGLRCCYPYMASSGVM